MFEIFNLDRLIYITPAIIIGLTFHEYAHGLAAYVLGDRTAYDQGRLTLNPIPHLDVMGLIMLYFAGFGWAKPVPVNPYNLRGNRDRAMLLVSLAGPFSNLLLAIVGAVLLGAFFVDSQQLSKFIQMLIIINCNLAIFNLLPIPPLDGSKILMGAFPGSKNLISGMEQYGVIILVILLFTGIFGKVLSFLLAPVLDLLYWIANMANLYL
ncbi:MAG: site-2 protease family protein [Peptococcaceae bacterium]|nr:site-2 protease family protein [Peptococcaceae bacterium]